VRLLNCVNDYFLVVRALVRLLLGGLRSCMTTSYYLLVDIRGTTLLPFFQHQLKIDYFEQLNTSTIGNGTAGASDTCLASGYNLELIRLFIVFFLFLHRLSVNMNNPYEAIILINNIIICLVTFGIKIYRIVPKFLTIQKLECCDRLSVTSFVVALKPNAFDGSNYKWCHNRRILWLTATNIIHVAKGKLEQLTSEEEQAFTTADNLFKAP
jgi:hypothetical protein